MDVIDAVDVVDRSLLLKDPTCTTLSGSSIGRHVAKPTPPTVSHFFPKIKIKIFLPIFEAGTTAFDDNHYDQSDWPILRISSILPRNILKVELPVDIPVYHVTPMKLL